MWKLIDQFIVVPFGIFAVLFGIGWLGQHPPALFLTIAALPIIFLILWIREQRNPHLAKKQKQIKFSVEKKKEFTEADFWEWFNCQDRK